MFAIITDRITSKLTRRHLRSFLEKHATKQPILEIGAKDRPYQDLFPNATTLDIEAHAGIDIVADLHKLPVKTNAYTTILCTEVLEHCYDPQQAISEMNRVLKPKGKLILSTRFLFPHHDVPHDYFRFTYYGLQHLLRNWEQVVIEPEATTQQALAILIQRIAFQSKLLLQLPVLNLALHLFAKAIYHSPNLMTAEYGSIEKKSKIPHLFTSGYYVVAYKK